MSKNSTRLRWASRVILLCLAIAALTPLSTPHPAAIILPSLSPYLAIVSAASLRAFSWVSVMAIPVLLLSLWRGRWFCRFACPAGLCFEMAGKAGKRIGIASRNPLRFRPGSTLLLIAIGGSMAGLPLFIWLDPLTLFNSAASIWTVPMSWQSALMACGFTFLLLCSLFSPNLWCFGICPLGTMQQWIGNTGRRMRQAQRKHQHADSATDTQTPSRRTVIGLLIGGTLGLVGRHAFTRRPVLRPPGSVEEDRFNALCTRCGNCIRICPEKILVPAGLNAGLDGMLTPVVRMLPGYCSEFCNACNTVCPSGAIRLQTLKHKRRASIGTAIVIRQQCLAWEEGKHCMACGEYCPYRAIDGELHRGVDCPVVDPDICRGCGRCQKECPAPKTAIIVEPGFRRQRARSGNI